MKNNFIVGLIVVLSALFVVWTFFICNHILHYYNVKPLSWIFIGILTFLLLEIFVLVKIIDWLED